LGGGQICAVSRGKTRGEEVKIKRRILLVDDEVAVLLTLKAVLEINGFDVDTAASAREGKLKLRSHQYQMVITDMRMERDKSGAEVIEAARVATYQPAIALLTAFPLADEDWQEMGADQMLVKPMHTRLLLQQIEGLMSAHESRVANEAIGHADAVAEETKKRPAARKTIKKKVSGVKGTKSAVLKKKVAKKAPRKKPVARKTLSKTAAKKGRKR
jgi:DNA-binding response OmpR family regulator